MIVLFVISIVSKTRQSIRFRPVNSNIHSTIGRSVIKRKQSLVHWSNETELGSLIKRKQNL